MSAPPQFDSFEELEPFPLTERALGVARQSALQALIDVFEKSTHTFEGTEIQSSSQ
jgi:hypothetical protein